MKLFQTFFCFLLIINGLSSQCEHPDYEGLMELYNATNEDGWSASFGWFQGSHDLTCNPCNYQGAEWVGVQCENNRVVRLDLLQFNLTGRLPDLNLDSLQYLNLIGNELEGEIPDFSHMPLLESLYLENNAFSGNIPKFEKLSSIKQISILNNQLTGSIPDYSHLPNLALLDVSKNMLDGELLEVQNMPSIVEYYCSNNQLTGSVPLFNNCPNLRFVQIGSNALTGPIPDFSMSNVDASNLLLFCSFNKLSGCYPDNVCDIGNLIAFQNVDLPWGGDIEPFCAGLDQIGAPCENPGIPNPHILEDCSCYTELCEASHPDLEGMLAIYEATNGAQWTNNDGWWQGKAGIACDPCRLIDKPWYGVICENNRVVCLDMDGDVNCTFNGTTGNNMTGALPDIKLDFLRTIILDNNHINGELPDLTRAPRLKKFWCSYNNFEGVLDEDILVNLEEFRGSFNNFSGPIPNINNLPNLDILSVSNNRFTGCYPDAVCDLVLFDVNENFELPWEGDFVRFCNGEDQMSAPCSSYNTQLSGTMTEECLCEIISNVSDSNSDLVQLYPNPCANLLHVKNKGRNLEYRIKDIHDREVKNDVLLNDNSVIDVSDLGVGVYFIYLTYDETTPIVKKFIKV